QELVRRAGEREPSQVNGTRNARRGPFASQASRASAGDTLGASQGRIGLNGSSSSGPDVRRSASLPGSRKADGPLRIGIRFR
ncbi:hypothetical protein ABTN08_20170, partial [Acinetobacter baumannii]